MKTFPAALERLSEQFARLPGIGSKTAQRLAFQVLSMPQEQAQEFADAILDAKRTVHTCPVCQNLTDQELCGICADSTRDHTTICVVAEPRDVIAMERSREYTGVYHVLHGVIRRSITWDPTISASASFWSGSKTAACRRSSWRRTPTPRARRLQCTYRGF